MESMVVALFDICYCLWKNYKYLSTETTLNNKHKVANNIGYGMSLFIK